MVALTLHVRQLNKYNQVRNSFAKSRPRQIIVQTVYDVYIASGDKIDHLLTAMAVVCVL